MDFSVRFARADMKTLADYPPVPDDDATDIGVWRSGEATAPRQLKRSRQIIFILLHTIP
jgi:hypothetical protein